MKKINLCSITVILTIMYSMLFLSSCAEVQPHIKECTEGHIYGFFGGLCHGIIAPFAFIYSLFNNNIAVWAVNNNGSWYTFGFLLGIGGLTSGASRSSK